MREGEGRERGGRGEGEGSERGVRGEVVTKGTRGIGT